LKNIWLLVQNVVKINLMETSNGRHAS